MSDAAACDDSANLAHASTECQSHSPRVRLGPTLSDRKAWHVPILLITSELLLAELWQHSQPASSVLLVLVMYAPLLAAGAQWTEWFQLDYARIEALAGVSHGSVVNAFKALRGLGLIQARRVRSLVDPLHTPQEYRVSARLYTKASERFVRVRAPLITSGAWSAMPSPAARHLWLAVRALDPVQDSASFAAKLEAMAYMDEDEAAERIADIRQEGAPSVAKLSRITGLSRPAVAKLRAGHMCPRTERAA